MPNITRGPRGAKALSIAAAGLMLSVLCSEAMARPSGVLRVGTTIDLKNWNPQTHINSVFVQPVYEGLIQLGVDGATFEPLLAESWEMSAAEVSFKLRQGVTFHDGAPFNADAVVANIEALKKASNRWADSIASIDKAVKVDDYNVKFLLKYPAPSLLYALTQVGLSMVSPKALADGSWLKAPVGTGPYIFDEKSSVSGSKYIFRLNEKYHSLDSVGLAGIELIYFPDTSSRFNAVLTNQVDAAEGDPTQLQQAEAAGLKNHPWTVIRYHMIFFDQKLFANPLVRKAMCMAIPREKVNIARFGGLAKIATQMQDPSEPGYVANLKGYPDDMEAAKSLMKEAGNPKISIKFPTYESQRIFGQLLKETYAQLGITLELIMMPNTEYFQTMYTGKYPLLYNVLSPEYGGMFNYYPFRFAKDGAGNTFRNDAVPELEQAYQNALKATDDKRAEYLQEITKTIYDQALDCGFHDVAHVINFNPKRVTQMVTTRWQPSSLRYKAIRVAN